MATDLVKNSKDVEIEKLRQELDELRNRPPQEAGPAQQGPAFESQQADNRDTIQVELDTFEEYVLNTIFPNGIKTNSFIKTFLTMKGKTEVELINESIVQFEQAVRPFMSPDGTLILTGKPSELIRLATPLLQKLGQMIGGQ